MKNFLYSKQSVYRERYFLYQYNDNDFRLCCQKYSRSKGFEETKPNFSFIPRTEPEEIQRISLSRSKREIRELCLCNGFTHFATLTVAEKNCDRFSLTKCQKLLKYKIKEKIRRKNKDFAYIFITEKHKNGAFHFHGLVKNLDFYTNEYGYLSNKVFDEIGFNSFSPIRDFSKTCNYILKYITKDCIKNEHNQIYISSRGLKKALKYEIQPISFNSSFENDFCKISDYNLSTCTREEIFLLMNIIDK